MLPITLTAPLAFLDIESTGTNPWQDRLIDLALVIIHPDQSRTEHTYRVNPGRPIPLEATKVHHITDDDVKDAPIFATIAQNVADILKDCDLGGFNLIRFDVPLLAEEFNRADIPFSLDGRRIIDMQRIYHKREPRTLEAALKFYCNESLVNAHSALADTRATVSVFEGQLKRYPDLPQGMDALHKYCSTKDPKAVDSTGKLIWNSDQQIAINFGKRKGELLRDIVTLEKSFVKWLLNADFPRDVKEIVENASRGIYPAPPPVVPAEPDDGDAAR